MSNRYRSSRANRWEEITHQEQLILAKKREIEERLKPKPDDNPGRIEGNVPSINQTSTPPSSSSSSSSSSSVSISSSFSQAKPFSCLSSSTTIPPKETTTTSPSTIATDLNIINTFENKQVNPLDKSTFVNKFSNDGSFLEMFKKMQQQKSESSSSSSIIIKVEETEPSENETQSKLEDIDERIRFSEKDCDLRVDQQHTKKVSPSGEDEIRVAIEKSAIYVAMNGSEAEARLKSDCINDSDYRWLYQEDNVNHQYYKRRIEELKEAKSRAADFELSSSSSSPSTSSTRPSDDFVAAMNDHDDRNPAEGKGKKRKESRWSEPSTVTSTITSSDYASENVYELGESSNSASAPLPQDPELVKYAIQVYGKCELTADQWKQLEDQRKMKVLVAMMSRKKAKREKFEASGRPMYEYDSDEEVEGGTWEHRKRMEEMEQTKEWAEKLNEMNKGKHHIGDFLPPDQLERFMKKWDSIKDGSTSLLFDEDYKDFKLQSQNQGYKMLENLGWTEGQGLGSSNQGTTKPVDVDAAWGERTGLGQKRPDELRPEDDEYEAYRKRMMLAYRFRPNPLNNPRRPYY